MSTSPDSIFAAQRLTTLFVNPAHADHALLQKLFSHGNWNARSAFTCDEALQVFRGEFIPVVVCDRDLLDGDWRTLREEFRAIHPASRIILLSRKVDCHLWCDVAQMGGYGLLEKP